MWTKHCQGFRRNQKQPRHWYSVTPRKGSSGCVLLNRAPFQDNGEASASARDESIPTRRTSGPTPDSTEEKLHCHPNFLFWEACPLPIIRAIGDHPPWRKPLCCLRGLVFACESLEVLSPSTCYAAGYGYPPSQ